MRIEAQSGGSVDIGVAAVYLHGGARDRSRERDRGWVPRRGSVDGAGLVPWEPVEADESARRRTVNHRI
jgi:hypothetical protein